MSIPEELKYTADHEWIKIEGDKATVGITDFAQSELGDIVFVEVESVGNSLAANDIFGTVEAVKTVSDLFMPVGATVLEKNEALDNEPELINTDPYGDGWIIKVQLEADFDASKLLDADAYRKEIGN